MHFTLFDFDGFRAAVGRRYRAQTLDGLNDRLLEDIGYTRDGRPIDPDGTPRPGSKTDTLSLIAPAMLLLLMH